ncbi:ABC transporter substrate-binding protein [Clostridium vincentii]|uniref:D-allose-binding periplasmic protein n=1 Tax=Clostridium vincentii TaxID=52704 RepID=A0A2T0BBT3_9CLOT|nr:ABC transporter substrate-binding protein [Clostridium vincentii]PRR81361.1 D-allose-binding periplasmic protein precursor [Clostridium vincentii]
MKNIKVFCSICCPIFIALFLVSCGNSNSSTKVNESLESKDEEEIYIPIISKGWQHQYWQSVKMGANKAAKDYNVRITFEGPEGDAAINKQIEMIESALSKEPSALVLAACNSDAVIPQLEKAKAANIPIIGFDSGVDSDIPITMVATDNEVASSAAADKLAAAIGQEGEIAVICHDSVSTTGTERRDGFVNQMKEKYPNIKVVAVEYSGGDHDISQNITRTIIDKYPNIKGIFATNEGSAYGLINGVIEKDKVGKIVLVGFDAGKLQKESVRNGTMLGAISQDPFNIGYKAVEAAYKASKGEELTSTIDTGYKWYDKTNMDDEDMKTLLYD